MNRTVKLPSLTYIFTLVFATHTGKKCSFEVEIVREKGKTNRNHMLAVEQLTYENDNRRKLKKHVLLLEDGAENLDRRLQGLGKM